MQRLFTLLLLCGIIGQASVRTAWALHYQWNRAAYVAQCKNKDKPRLHCDGQCGFMKQIAAAREKNRLQEPQLPENFQYIKDVQLFFEPAVVLLLAPEPPTVAASIPMGTVRLPDAPVSDIFKPPA